MAHQEQIDAIAEAVQEVLDAAFDRGYVEAADETFVHCLVCGETDGHTLHCFVPSLEDWMRQEKLVLPRVADEFRRVVDLYLGTATGRNGGKDLADVDGIARELIRRIDGERQS